jgi:ATP citrate (pro-S)-lyase
MMVLLGEVGGIEEYQVANAIKLGRITKPVIAWCIGTCAGMFGAEVQFGHAGALANSNSETAEAKNKALRESGAVVPQTFEELPLVLNKVFEGLVKKGTFDVYNVDKRRNNCCEAGTGAAKSPH